MRRFRVPALVCALCVLVCELISRPYTTMGVGDDGPYVLMAHALATTGHIVYNAWASPMLTAQLYLAAAFIKIFGFSFTTVRMSTLLIATVLAFVLQRTLVRCGIHERNATLGTLAFVLSPLYLMLSVTFMSDITGLFAIVICLYGCLRTLQSNTQRAALLWLAFAVATNVFFGTSRQIAWLGTLVMVPCTLWLLRAQRRVLVIGAALNLAGFVAIFACLQWLKHQRYVIPLPLFVHHFPILQALAQLSLLLLDCPFLLLPLIALFLPELRKSSLRTLVLLTVFFAALFFLALYPSHLRGAFDHLLEPTTGLGSWVTIHGFIEVFVIPGTPPVFLNRTLQLLLTVVCVGGLAALLLSLRRARSQAPAPVPADNLSHQLTLLIAPFSAAYCFLLLSAAGTTNLLYDRYSLGLLVVLVPSIVRFYQQRIHAQLPRFGIAVMVLMAVYGIAQTHNSFALDRARVTLADELQAAGLPDTALDGSWESNLDVELRHADHINNPLLLTPANGYTPVAPPPPGPCRFYWYDRTPHIHPLYSVSFDPDACYGAAPFAPVHYSRWPYAPGTLYVVRFAPAAHP